MTGVLGNCHGARRACAQPHSRTLGHARPTLPSLPCSTPLAGHPRPQRRLQPLHSAASAPPAPSLPLSVPSFRLPNGLVLRHFTQEELNFLYREVQVDRIYLRHGVTLRPGDTVVDVGANTGLFTLQAAEEVGPSGRVISLEPLPRTYSVLAANVASHAEWCRARGREPATPLLFNRGAGPPGVSSAVFTTYSESASGWATMRPDDAEVAANMEAYILALLRGDVQEAAAGAAAGAQGQGAGVESAAEPVNVPGPLLARVAQAVWRWLPPARPLLRGAARLFVARMLSGQQRVACELVALGPLAAELGLQRIDLLKVDAERAEMEVLSGLSAADWALVRQVVLEVHDLDDGEEGGAGAHTGPGTAGLGALEAGGSQPAPPHSPQAERLRQEDLRQREELLRGQARQQKPGSEAGAGESSAVESCGLGASSAAPRGRLAAVQELLRAVGFAHVVCEQEPGLRGTTIYNVWATRA